MSHIKTIHFVDDSATSGVPTRLIIDYEADTDGEHITLAALVTGATIDPPVIRVPKGSDQRPESVTITRGTFAGRTVLVQATIMIDRDHGSSAIDNIELT